MKRIVAIRVDVDTAVGLKKGVPNLLKIFARHNVKATFFIVMGPDSMGKHIKRFKKKGYLKRILSVNPVRLVRNYGIASFFYGTLLPSPLIGEANPGLLKAIAAAGHELGVHGYNHAQWADYYASFTYEEVAAEFKRASCAYQRVFGKMPASYAAPNWRSHERLFRVEDEHQLRYSSDMRGYYPFRPMVRGITFNTLQIPVTLSSTHECLQRGLCKGDVVPSIFQEATEGINVWTIHDWYEGLCEGQFVEEFITLAKDNKYHFSTLDEIAGECLRHPDTIQACPVENRSVAGGIGDVTWQVIDPLKGGFLYGRD